MTTEIAKRNSALPAVIDTTTLQNTATALKRLSDEGMPVTRLKMLSSDGTWSFGEGLEVEEDSLWAVNMNTVEMGYAAWGMEKTELEGASPVIEMYRLNEVPVADIPTLRELPLLANREWQSQAAVMLTCLTGRDCRTTVQYKTSTASGIAELARFYAEAKNPAMEDVAAGIPNPRIIPCVRLGNTKAKNKRNQAFRKPVLEIEGVYALDDVPMDAEPAAAPAAAPARVRASRATAAVR